MAIMVINMSQRIIDGLLPQQHREIDKEQAKRYKRLFSEKDVKVVEFGEEAPKEEEKVDTVIDNNKYDDKKVVDETANEVVEEITPDSINIQSQSQPIATNDDDGMF